VPGHCCRATAALLMSTRCTASWPISILYEASYSYQTVSDISMQQPCAATAVVITGCGGPTMGPTAYSNTGR
jgi:hypothetical protein